MAFSRGGAHAHRVNFVSHAAVASWYDPSPAFVFGAMLPDFISMLRLKPPPTSSAELARGIRFHHLSDEAFHESPAFAALTRDARGWLRAAGLARGPTRAVAHIGVELLLDPVLLRPGAAQVAYRGALAAASATLDALGLRADETARLRRLTELLHTRESPGAAQDPASTVARIRRALAGRPRLALADADDALVLNWVVAAEATVVRCAPDVIRHLLTQLDGQGFGNARRELPFT
jgi:hypothetical protein